MKIEDSPFRFGGTSPVEKLRRQHAAVEFSLDDLDLSFLDLLTAVASESNTERKEAVEREREELQKAEKPPAGNSEATGKPKLTLVTKPNAPAPAEDIRTEVAEDMQLLNNELSPLDIQYMKQTVIPALPILMGSVPIESVFPTEPDGSISYRGHEISPSLAELIEKGYKSGRPIRVELDPKSAVVLKIRNGQVSAEFVSTDKTMHLVMQQELDDLRHRMTLKNLPVGTLDAKYRDPEQSRQQNSEDDDEAQ
ncbi:MAG TPA: hypothetical protein V6C52_09465 [Coleofasciculaceae cyanobacterium]|jgi:hypothetical protein